MDLNSAFIADIANPILARGTVDKKDHETPGLEHSLSLRLEMIDLTIGLSRVSVPFLGKLRMLI